MSLHPQLDDLLELRHQARALGVAASHLVNSTFTGLYASVFRGTGLDFDEVREYREGDDIRNMDWLVTARTDVPHLKVFREERQRSVILCIDTGPHMSFGTRGTFKSIQAARTAALPTVATTPISSPDSAKPPVRHPPKRPARPDRRQPAPALAPRRGSFPGR